MSEPGTYVLSEDVEHAGALRIEVAQGEALALDLRGHRVTTEDMAVLVDVSASKGDVTITDSTYEPSEDPEAFRAPVGALELSIDDLPADQVAGQPSGQPASQPAVVKRDIGEDESRGTLTISSVELDVSATTLESASIVQTGSSLRDGSQEPDEVPVTLRDCVLKATRAVDEDATPARPEDARDAAPLTASALDAGAKGVRLEGFLQADGIKQQGASSEAKVVFASAFERAYRFGPDFKPFGKAALSFAFPSKAEVEAAVVAQADDEEGVSEKAREMLAADEGILSWNEKRTEMSVVKPAAADSAASEELAGGLDARSDEQVAVQGIARGDLYASWAAQEGGFDKTYTIKSAGMYYLDRDLTAKNALVIDAPGQAVVLKLNGHEMKLAGIGDVAKKSMLLISNASSVEIDGAAASGTSRITSSGEYDVRGVSCEADGCDVSINDVTIAMKPKDRSQLALNVHAVYAAGGTLQLMRATLNVDLSEQAQTNNSGASVNEVTSAVYASSYTQRVALADCSVSCIGSPAYPASTSAELRDPGNVYCLYSRSDDTVVTGGTFYAEAASGNAACLCGKVLEVSGGGDVTLKANAGGIAAGIATSDANSVRLKAHLAYSTDADFLAACAASATLWGTASSAFVLSSEGIPDGSQPYSVLIRNSSTLDSANSSDTNIASFEGVLTSAERQQWRNALVNAFGADAPCDVSVESTRVYFSLVHSRAVAKVGNGYFGNITDAITNFNASDGATLELLADVGDMRSVTARSGVIQMSGHSAASLEYAAEGEGSSAPGVMVTNGSIAGERNFGTDLQPDYSAVRQRGACPLTLEGVSVRTSALAHDVSAVSAAAGASGDIVLSAGTNLVATGGCLTTMTTVYGVDIDAASTSALKVSDSTVHVAADGSNVSAYGISASAAAAIEDSAITVDGLCQSVGGVLVGGSEPSSIQGSRIAVTTSQAVPSACGIGGVPNVQPSSVAVRDCSVDVISASDVTGCDYWCLRSATGSTLSSTTTWVLGGTCSFSCSGDSHVGYNAAPVKLDSDFALDASNGHASTLTVHQGSCEGDVGFASSDSSDISGFASLFEPMDGSYYQGWELGVQSGDAMRLAWRPDGATADGAVLLKHPGASDRWFDRFSDAVAAASSGDTVQLACDVSEPNAIAVSLRDLTIDLDGHDLVMRVPNRTDGQGGTDAAIEYTGAGELSITSPSQAELLIEVGNATAPAAGATYQGICVSGGGTLSVSEDSAVHVAYAGATKSSQQREVSLYGVTVTDGSVHLDGDVEVTGSQASGATGALVAVGVRAAAVKDATASIEQAPTSSVVVNNETAAPVTDNSIYQTSLNYSYAQPTVREFFPEPGGDLYNAIQAQFKVSASYDQPSGYNTSNEFGAGIYYVSSPMTLDCPGTWYDNLKVWAYSDVVPLADVGKLDSIAATHFFMQAPYDTLTEAYGIQSAASSEGAVSVTAEGSTSCAAAHGTAVALQALGGSTTEWDCKGATLSARADSALHSLKGDALDLRDYITFEKTFSDPVLYSTNHGMDLSLARYEIPLACGLSVGDEASVTLDGAVSFSERGENSLDIQAKRVSATDSFAPASGTCTLEANGGNSEGDVFCAPREGATLDPSLFLDPTGAFASSLGSEGSLVWEAGGASKVVEFKVGEAVVKRYVGSSPIDLSEPSGLTARPGNMMSSFKHTGWSTSPDEFSAFEYGKSGMLDVSALPASTVLHATYEVVASSNISVSFANVRDRSGQLVSTPSFTAEYGQTLGEALADASADMPVPQNYYDAATGATYCFVGWHDYSTASPTALRQYTPDTAADSIVFDYSLTGTSASNVVLWATYVPVSATQRLVVFQVDHLLSAYAAEIGTRPVYAAAGTSNRSLSTPVKAVQATGAKYTFESWTDKASGQKYDTVLPVIASPGEALVYSASFTDEANKATIQFFYLHKPSPTSTELTMGVPDEPVKVSTTYDHTVQSEADKLAAIGSTIGSGGIVYTMRGWALRASDIEPVYDAENPIPSGSYADKTVLSDAYSRKYYAIYDSTAHMVRVSFYNGSAGLGVATVESGKNVNEALSAAGVQAPPDRSASEQFLGWATTDGSSEYLNPYSATIESLVNPTDSALSLYAVYGEPPTYQVMMYKAQGEATALYQLPVPRYKTIAGVAAENGITISAPYRIGYYFSGWYGASGRRYTLDYPVTGTLNLYAGYSPIQTSFDSGDPTSATVTYTGSDLEGASSVVFSLTSTSGAENMIRSSASAAGYRLAKSYSMRLTANYGDEAKTVTGTFGAAAIQLYVGRNLAGSNARVFWVGGDGRASASAAKTVDANGYISVSIGDYQVGDVTEGGNFMVGVSTANSQSSGSATTIALGGNSSGGDGGSSLSSGGLGSASLDASGISLASNGLSASAGEGASSLSDSAKATSKAGGGSDEVDMDELEEGADGSADGESASPLETLFESWDGNVALLIALIALAIALLARLVWWFIASRKDRDEEDEDSNAEMNVSPLLLEGIRF